MNQTDKTKDFERRMNSLDKIQAIRNAKTEDEKEKAFEQAYDSYCGLTDNGNLFIEVQQLLSVLKKAKEAGLDQHLPSGVYETAPRKRGLRHDGIGLMSGGIYDDGGFYLDTTYLSTSSVPTGENRIIFPAVDTMDQFRDACVDELGTDEPKYIQAAGNLMDKLRMEWDEVQKKFYGALDQAIQDNLPEEENEDDLEI